jgi:hypothetical protein
MCCKKHSIHNKIIKINKLNLKKTEATLKINPLD